MSDGRHLLKNVGKKSKSGSGKTEAGQKNWKKRTLKILSIVGGVLVVLTAAAYAYIKLAVGPPPVVPIPKNPIQQRAEDPNYTPPPTRAPNDPEEGEENIETKYIERNEQKYTFIMFCNDDVGGNTDVIMVTTFDANDYTMNVVSIPRDTMSNVSWSSKKANAIRANWRIHFRGQENAKEKAMQATIESFSDILGFEVDYWFNVDMKAFVTLVDAVGGVDYYIPSNMEYHDNEQNLHISYKQGMKTGITGKQALEILRFRRYASGDIARISNQQGFLKAAAEQILAKRNSINIIDLANIVINCVDTNLPLNHLIWFGKEFLKMESDDINFVTMPGNYSDSVGGVSYVSIYVNQWLEMVNELLNPFSKEITAQDVSILTRSSDRKLYVTDGNRQGNSSWGADSRGAGEPSGSSGNSSSSSTNSNSSSSQSSKPSSNQSSSSSGNSTNSPPDSSGDDPDTTPPDDVEDPQETEPGENELPSDEIPPIETDTGQTQDPVETPAQTGAPSDTQPEAPPEVPASAPAESGE